MLSSAILESFWYQTRSKPVQKAINCYPPDRLYRHNPTGQIVPIHAYSECGEKCTILILKANNPAIHFECEVAGIPLQDLQILKPYERIRKIEKRRTAKG